MTVAFPASSVPRTNNVLLGSDVSSSTGTGRWGLAFSCQYTEVLTEQLGICEPKMDGMVGRKARFSVALHTDEPPLCRVSLTAIAEHV